MNYKALKKKEEGRTLFSTHILLLMTFGRSLSPKITVLLIPLDTFSDIRLIPSSNVSTVNKN